MGRNCLNMKWATVIFVISLTVFSAAIAKDLRLIEAYEDEEPVEEPTEPPTEPPTDPPTDPPTEPPTEEPTESPTEAPTTKDPDNGSFQISLGLIPFLTALLCVTFQL